MQQRAARYAVSPGATPGCILFCGRALRSLKSRLDYRVIHRLRIRRSLPPTLGTSSTNERVSIMNDRSLFLFLFLSFFPLSSSSLCLSFSCLPPPLSLFLSLSLLRSFPPNFQMRSTSFLKRIPIKRTRMSFRTFYSRASPSRCNGNDRWTR